MRIEIFLVLFLIANFSKIQRVACSYENPPSLEIKMIAEMVKPIYYFDKNSGANCFPDVRIEQDWNVLDSNREGICSDFSPRAPLYFDFEECKHQDEIVFQFMTWYGKQRACFDIGFFRAGDHGDDYERVVVWYSRRLQRVTKVKYHQHSGWYIVTVEQGAPIEHGRPVVYVGKINHGAYHFPCEMYSLTKRKYPMDGSVCLGTCLYWDDLRDANGTRFVLKDSILEYRRGRDRDSADNEGSSIQCQYDWSCDPTHRTGDSLRTSSL